MLESVYEEALVCELTNRGLKVERQRKVPVVYKGVLLSTELRLDVIVEDMVIVELKSVAELLPVHFKQILTYLRLTGKHLGILVNFNTDDIVHKGMHRVVN